MSKCIVCDTIKSDLLYSGIMRCGECGHVFSGSIDSVLSAAAAYGNGYFFGGEYSDYIADKKITQDNFRLRLKVLDKFLDPLRHKSLLEIGSAYGFFLDVAKNRFEKLKGIDVTSEGILHAKEKLGLDAEAGDFLKHDFKGQSFDVVCLWDTIEHLKDPSACLAKISGSMTKKGALVAITTGDIGSLNARMKKDRWRIMQAPTHLHYFSKNTLSRLLAENGFEIAYAGHCGFYRSLDMAFHRISLGGRASRSFYKIMHRTGLLGFRFYLNLYDIMYIIARKI